MLIVSTHASKLGDQATGGYLMKIAYPFQVFVDAGKAVDVVTPVGGPASDLALGRSA